MAWTIIPPAGSRGGGRSPVDYAIRLSVHKGSSPGRDMLAITVSKKMLKELRWQVGDRVMVMINDDTGDLGLRRTTLDDGGSRKLTHSGSAKGSKRPPHATVKLSVPSITDFVNGKPRQLAFEDVPVIDDVVVIPKIETNDSPKPEDTTNDN